MICGYINFCILSERYQSRVHIEVFAWRIVEPRGMNLNFLCALPAEGISWRFTMSLINFLNEINQAIHDFTNGSQLLLLKFTPPFILLCTLTRIST